MARRTHLKPENKRLLERIRGQHWTVEELRWVLTHLDPCEPTLSHLWALGVGVARLRDPPPATSRRRLSTLSTVARGRGLPGFGGRDGPRRSAPEYRQLARMAADPRLPGRSPARPHPAEHRRDLGNLGLRGRAPQPVLRVARGHRCGGGITLVRLRDWNLNVLIP
jgi:hypothetical protein